MDSNRFQKTTMIFQQLGEMAAKYAFKINKQNM